MSGFAANWPRVSPGRRGLARLAESAGPCWSCRPPSGGGITAPTSPFPGIRPWTRGVPATRRRVREPCRLPPGPDHRRVDRQGRGRHPRGGPGPRGDPGDAGNRRLDCDPPGSRRKAREISGYPVGGLTAGASASPSCLRPAPGHMYLNTEMRINLESIDFIASRLHSGWCPTLPERLAD